MSDPSIPPVLSQSERSRDPSLLINHVPASAHGTDGDAQEGFASGRGFVFAMLFGVTGALGLPLLWISPAFSRTEKLIWSVLNILYTAVLIYIAIISLRVIFDALEQLH